MKDILNREIKPGDHIAYAATYGRSAALRHALVLEVGKKVKAEILETPNDHWTRPKPGRAVHLKYGDRIMVVSK
jgi:thiamine monophosphate kinase